MRTGKFTVCSPQKKKYTLTCPILCLPSLVSILHLLSISLLSTELCIPNEIVQQFDYSPNDNRNPQIIENSLQYPAFGGQKVAKTPYNNRTMKIVVEILPQSSQCWMDSRLTAFFVLVCWLCAHLELRAFSCCSRVILQVQLAASGNLILKSGPDFLTKTEDPLNRRRPWRISPLPADDRSLCPALAMQVYLRRTADIQYGSLFRHHTSGKPLSLSAARCRLTSLIKRHNPDSIPKTHDICKMVSSLAFFEGMSFPDISHMTGWTSPFVLMCNYFHEIEMLA